LRYSLSYRDLEEIMAERNLSVDHVTIWRWVQRHAPILNQRIRREIRHPNRSWRVDETYVKVAGSWAYLYRAVDSAGETMRAACSCITLFLIALLLLPNAFAQETTAGVQGTVKDATGAGIPNATLDSPRSFAAHPPPIGSGLSLSGRVYRDPKTASTVPGPAFRRRDHHAFSQRLPDIGLSCRA
jgi:hypothetical protein